VKVALGFSECALSRDVSMQSVDTAAIILLDQANFFRLFAAQLV
jgi:hypothetical protein